MADYPVLSHDALSDYYKIKNPSLYQNGTYNVSRYYTEVVTTLEIGGWKRRNQIGKKLILGKLPAFGQQTEIINSIPEKEELGLVLSILDYFELAGYGVVPPIEWEKRGINHYMLPMRDFTSAAPNESIIAAVKVMKDFIDQGKMVYVHCKAGRSRSAMLCIIYLALYGNGDDLKPTEIIDEETIKNLEKYIKKECERKQVELHPEQRQKALEIIKQIKAQQQELTLSDEFVMVDEEAPSAKKQSSAPKNSEKIEAENRKSKFIDVLSSLELKNAIVHLPAFKQLALYTYKVQGYVFSNNATNLVQSFFDKIYYAQNEDWYFNLVNRTGPLDDFVKVKRSYLSPWENLSGITQERETLRTNFINELNASIAKKLSCTIEEIEELKTGFNQTATVYAAV